MDRKSVKKQFGENADAYVTSKVHAKGASLARLIELTNPQPNWKVLDVATGAGHTALAFAPYVTKVIASDVTPEMLQNTAVLAQERNITNLTTKEGDAEDLPFADGEFDCVTCRIAPHHFPHIDQFVRESARVLKSGGVLAVVDNVVPAGEAGTYVNAFEKLRDPSHGRCLSIAEWEADFAQAGLEILHSETLEKTMEFEWWAHRMTNDDALVAEIKTMLLNAKGGAHDFLQPSAQEPLTFRLVEGVFVGKRP